MDIPYKIVARTFRPDESTVYETPPELRKPYELIQRRDESISLALLLGVTGDPAPKATRSWTAIFDPLAHSVSRSWRPVATMPPIVPVRLTAPQVRRWGQWIALVDEQRTPSIDIAIKRALQAAAERRNPSDALLDAVIAWENLVGADDATHHDRPRVARHASGQGPDCGRGTDQVPLSPAEPCRTRQPKGDTAGSRGELRRRGGRHVDRAQNAVCQEARPSRGTDE